MNESHASPTACTGPLPVSSEGKRSFSCGQKGTHTCCQAGILQSARAGRAPAAPSMRRSPAHSGAGIASGGPRGLRPLGQAHEVCVHEQRAVARRHRRHLHRRRRVLPGAHVHQPLRAITRTASRTLTAVRLPRKAKVHGRAGKRHAGQCAGVQRGRAGHASSCVTDCPYLLPGQSTVQLHVA